MVPEDFYLNVEDIWRLSNSVKFEFQILFNGPTGFAPKPVPTFPLLRRLSLSIFRNEFAIFDIEGDINDAQNGSIMKCMNKEVSIVFLIQLDSIYKIGNAFKMPSTNSNKHQRHRGNTVHVY